MSSDPGLRRRLVAVQAVYWLVTHSLNRYWLRDTLEAERETQPGFASRFFLSDPAGNPALEVEPLPADWTPVRDRWECSHAARAGLALVSLIAVVGQPPYASSRRSPYPQSRRLRSSICTAQPACSSSAATIASPSRRPT